jgi:hypothetical protein
MIYSLFNINIISFLDNLIILSKFLNFYFSYYYFSKILFFKNT